MSEARGSIDQVLREERRFPPPAAFAEKAHVRSIQDYERLYRRSIDDPDGYWADVARELHWFAPWSKVLEWKPPHSQWFVGGRTNLSFNCLDRHLSTWRRNKAAIVF